MAKMKSDDLSAFLSSKYKLDDCICGTRENPLLISLFEINDESCISFISVQMCDIGLAQLSKITLEEEVTANNLSTCLLNGMERENSKDKFSNEGLPSEISKFMQDGMNDEYLSYRNSYLVDMDNPGVATVSYEAKDEKRVCKYFDKAGGCWWGHFCKYEHTRAQPTSVTADRQLLFYENFNLAVIELVESEWYYVSISVMVNPQKFFVVLPFANVAAEQVTLRGESPLQMLMESLNSCYNSKIYQDHDLTLYNIGELVVARSQTFELWHRARVLEHYSHEEDLCQVYYVDYGNTEVIPINRLRCIEPQFIEIPYQAIQSSLPIMPADSLSWSQQAIDYFASLVTDRYCLAQINRSHSFRDFPCEMYLYTLTSSENICDLMVERGYAKYCSSLNSFSQNSFSDDVACESPLESAKFWPG
ncbi:hypothetical protein HELRODRAFT_190063 [Helobdella robusta]|uniref:C3H1-type domain-containing protein n=1 Tax=Helobdella robusta TaxID=6412 RepID=T1FRN0_HELRO|nr:hypothetical protein HELRODRAFT_190063 [Helobdella robusta]ESO11855.1 hypothetical protein HELRODRAFT_190063 [Helobdella robusta]